MVEVVDTTDPITNYKPTWSSYTWTASTTVESWTVKQWDVYIYDGTPVPPGPTPGGKDNAKKWHYRKSRKVNVRIWQNGKFYYIIKEKLSQ